MSMVNNIIELAKKKINSTEKLFCNKKTAERRIKRKVGVLSVVVNAWVLLL